MAKDNLESIPYMSAAQSAAQTSPRPRVFKRGGKRDRQACLSHALTWHQAGRVLCAIHAAHSVAMPLTRFVTIHWERQGVPHGQGGQATSALTDKARRALSKRGQAFAYVWVRENAGHGGKGDHVHMLYHARTYPGFAQDMRRWIKAISGKPYRTGVIETRTIARTLKASQTTPEAFKANLAAVAAYILKSASADAAAALALPRHGEGGPVTGQRIGMSKNLARLVPRCRISR